MSQYSPRRVGTHTAEQPLVSERGNAGGGAESQMGGAMPVVLLASTVRYRLPARVRLPARAAASTAPTPDLERELSHLNWAMNTVN
jgi:hypothetical protein